MKRVLLLFLFSVGLSIGVVSANSQALLKLIIKDDIAPEITLHGDEYLEIFQGNPYQEGGASCTDNYDRTCTVKNSGTVDTTVLGEYRIKYTATDANGNTSQKTRKILVSRGKIPSVLLLGEKVIHLKPGEQYIEMGAIAYDAEDGNLNHKIQIFGSGFDTNIPGTYIISYQVIDSDGNISDPATRKVIVAKKGSSFSGGGGGMGSVQTHIEDEEMTHSVAEELIKALHKNNMTYLKQIDKNIFNPDFQEHQCYALLDEKTINQGNKVSESFKIAHQMLYSYGQTLWRGTKDFAPERKLSRQEAAKFMVEFARKVLCRAPNYKYTNQFVDIEKADPSLIPFIRKSYEYKIFHGDGGLASKGEPTTFRPYDEISYDELMAVMVRLVTNEYDETQGVDWAKNYRSYISSHIKSTTVQNNYRSNVAEVMYDLYKLNRYTWEKIGFVIKK